MTFSENLKKYREKAGYSSAKDFAACMNLPYSTYAPYENESRGREPKYDTLVKIATVLNVSTDDLLGHNRYARAKNLLLRAGFTVTEATGADISKKMGIKASEKDALEAWVCIDLPDIKHKYPFYMPKDQFVERIMDVVQGVYAYAEESITKEIKLEFWPLITAALPPSK